MEGTREELSYKIVIDVDDFGGVNFSIFKSYLLMKRLSEVLLISDEGGDIKASLGFR